MFEKLFKLKEHNTTVKTEVLAGLTTFLAMAYILALNPQILGTVMDKSGVFVATAVSSAVATFVMAFLANYPIALSAGLGLNAYFAYTVCLGELKNVENPWTIALTAVFVEGVIFIILSVVKAREQIVNGIPQNLKTGITVGIGLFVAYIGLRNANIVTFLKQEDGSYLINLGDFGSADVALALIGFLIICILVHHKVPGAILIGMIITWVFAMIAQVGGWYTASNCFPDFSGGLQLGGITKTAFHFNFGWGGSSDGYFLLTAIPYSDFDFTTGEANNDGFNYVQDMVIGFEPDRDGSSVMAPERIIADNLAAVSARVKRSTPVKLSAYEVYNPSNTDLDITALGFFVKDSKGAVVDTAVAYRGYTPAGEPLDSLSALYEPATTLPAGDYTLTFGFCKKGSDEMKPAEIALGEPNGYSLHITADSAFYASLGQCDFQMQLITSPDTLTSDKPSTVTLRVTNRGGLYDGIVHFRLNVAGDAVKKHWYTSPNQTFTVGAGETKDLVFNQTFTLPGDDNYVITFFDRSNRPFFTDTIPVIGGEKEPDLLLVKETYFTPRDYQVPVNCLILNAEIRNDGGRYDGKMTVRIYDESNYFCDGAHMDTTHVVLPGGGAVTTVKLHGTYDTSNDWSLSNVRYATVLDLLTHTYLKPSKYNMHEFTLGAKDPSVTWTPETGIRDINSSAFKGKVSFDLNDRLLTVKADVTLASVSIFNANGELLIRQYEGSTVDLSALRPGVYVAVASAVNGQRAEKIVLK